LVAKTLMDVLVITHPKAKESTRNLTCLDGKAAGPVLQMLLSAECQELALNLAKSELPAFSQLPTASNSDDVAYATAVVFLASVAPIDDSKNWWVFIANLSEYNPDFAVGDWVGLFAHRDKAIAFVSVYHREDYLVEAQKIAAMTANEWRAFMAL